MGKKNFILLVSLTWLIVGCHKRIRMYYDYNYKGESNYKNVYLVDTISINDPIIIRYNGGRFIVPNQLLNKTVKINDKFLKRPDVFILGDNFYRDFNSKDSIKFVSYPEEGGCGTEKITSDIENVEVFRYKSKSVKFLLELVNVNYYNKTHNGYNTFEIENNDWKNSFYKVVFPLCK